MFKKNLLILILASTFFVLTAKESYAVKTYGSATVVIKRQYIVSNYSKYEGLDYINNAFVYKDNVDDTGEVTIIAF